MQLEKIIGLKVVAIKGFSTGKKKNKYIAPDYILFDDGKTFISLEEQDYYCYHDCSGSAREIEIPQEKKSWERIMENEGGNYPDANMDL